MTFGTNKQQWMVQIPGQPDTPVDTFTLSSWAKTKIIRADTQVTDIESGRTYTAAQIPGVYSEKEYLFASGSLLHGPGWFGHWQAFNLRWVRYLVHN